MTTLTRLDALLSLVFSLQFVRSFSISSERSLIQRQFPKIIVVDACKKKMVCEFGGKNKNVMMQNEISWAQDSSLLEQLYCLEKMVGDRLLLFDPENGPMMPDLRLWIECVS